MNSHKKIYTQLQFFGTIMFTLLILGRLTQWEAYAMDAPLSLSFSFTNQASDAAVAQPLYIKLRHSMSKSARCNVKLTAQVYTNVVPGTCAADFTISPTEISIASLPSGESVLEVQISFAKDGEYRIFGEASTDKGYAAAEGYCFIVRNGKLYGARIFDDCEGVIILNNAMRTKGNSYDVEKLRRQYQQRMQERETIKKGIRKSTKSGSGIKAGETVTLRAYWTGPREGGGNIVFPVLNCKVEVQKPGLLGWHTFANGFFRNGTFSFTSPDDDLDFRVKIIMEFDGFNGNSKFLVRSEGIFGSTYEKTLDWDDGSFQRNANEFTYTAPFHKWGDVDTDAEIFDSAWGVFHGVQEILRNAFEKLQIVRTDDTVVFFPHSPISCARGTDVWIHIGDRYDFDVVAHEIGHAIDSTYSVTDGSPGGGHYIDQNAYNSTAPGNNTAGNKDASLRLAISEAFATWFGVALLEDSDLYGGKLANVGDKKEDDTEDSTFSFSLESDTYGIFGEDAEVAIMQVFWDLHDGSIEDYGNGLSDGLWKGMAGMWNILKGYSYQNISDFWLRNWLPGGDFTKLSLESLAAAEIFVAMGMAPRITHPDNDTVIDLSQLQFNELRFDWEDNHQTGDNALTLNDYYLVIYKGDLSSIVWQKHVGDVNTYTLTVPEKDALRTAVGNYEGDLIAVVFGKNTPTSGSGIITTGPYASQGVRLARGGRYVAIVVDSSSSMSWNDPDNLRIEAAKKVCEKLVSAAEARAQNKIADKACGVNFDDDIDSTYPFSDPPELKPWLDTVDSYGNTRIDLGIDTAVSMILDAQGGGAQTKEHSAVLLFTDGENNDGPVPVIEAIIRAWANGVRVHYGWLKPGKGGPTTYAKSSKGIPSTIEEAVRMTGGNYGLIRDADSQLAFVKQVFDNGLTVIDNPRDTSAGGYIAGHVETPNDLGDPYRIQAYRFNGQANESIRILLKAVDFDPIVSLFDKDGAYLAVDYDDDGDRSIELPATLPYTGEYIVEVRGKGSQFGKYTILVEVENAPPFVDVTGQTTTSFGNWTLDRATGALVGSLTLQNNTGAPKSLRQKFWYVLPTTSNLRLANPDGVDVNGNPYVDITAAVEAGLPNVGNGDLVLDPGESVTITGIQFYSRDRSLPAGFVFAVWADPPLGSVPVLLPSVLSVLHIDRAAPGKVVLSWLATKASVVVEETDSLTSPNWTVIDAMQELRGDYVTVTLSAGSDTKFYRLRLK